MIAIYITFIGLGIPDSLLISQSVIGTQMAVSYAGIMVAPAVCGIMGQNISMGIFPVYLFVFYCIMLITTHRVKKKLRR